MNIVRDAFRDLREKRLWPIAAALVLALIGVPAFLSSTAASTPAPSVPQTQAAVNPGPAIPVISVNNTPAHSKLTGHGRNPFKGQGPSTSHGTTTTASSTTASGASNSGSSKSTTGGSSTTTTSSTTTPSSTPATTTTTTPVTPPAPAPTGLTSSQSYNVALSINNASGGLNAIPSVERLSILPSPRHPLLVELGVLKGGKHVLFAVQPGAVVHGPGHCAPGPVDCQILSLAAGQIESLKRAGANSGVLFSVTGIKAQQHGSAAAAAQLRNKQSAAGRRLLNADHTLPALSLFKYVPKLGAILDLRNLSVGGS